MTQNVQELEKILEEARKREHIDAMIKELESIKKEYEGKCFGSNLFNRLNKSRYFGIVYYEKFFIRDGEIYVIEWVLTGHRHPAFYKAETPTYNISSYINERKLSSNDYSVSYNLYNGYHFYRKPLTIKEFMSLWKAAKDCYLIIRDTFKSAPNLEIEDVRLGDHTNEQSIDKIISELGLDMIDLKKYPKMFWIFEYKNLPMLQNGRWLPRIYAKQLLEYVIKDYEKDNKSVWSSARAINYNNERIATIKEFINTEL